MSDETLIDRAVDVLRAGGLVAFPTETVYGLGADAANPRAVARIFAAKGRPADHPLIVHLAAADQLSDWALRIPEMAEYLAERFWPGPLALILKRASRVPDAVTGGQDTVALRAPDQPLAQHLLRDFGGGIAAPSANRFGRVSPTEAAHVVAELGSAVDLILDGGPCRVGVESTVLDLSQGRPLILRPGGVSREVLEDALGESLVMGEGDGVRSPGQLPSHYAPGVPVVITGMDGLAEEAERRLALGERLGLIAWDEIGPVPGAVRVLSSPGESLEVFGRQLYRRLREADRQGLDTLLVVLPPGEGLGLAIADRLRRAAAGGRNQVNSAVATVGEGP